jgi:nucleotide-binding universal stress UspA family protein
MGDQTMKNIVVGTDGSERAAVAVDRAVELARSCGAELHLVSAYKPINTEAWAAAAASAGGIVLDLRELPDPGIAVQEHLDGLARKLQHRSGVTVHTHARPGGAADVLLDVATDVDADLLVVGNRGMSGARRMLGSVPNTISHHAECAVMIVPTVDTTVLA